MTKSLRDRQKQMARDAILEALADEISSSGSFDFSVADVANRAGVSHRTVHNYFGSRQELIDAFSDWTDRTIHDEGGVIVPTSVESLAAEIAANFEVFEAQSEIAEVLARLDTAERATPGHRRRTEAFDAVVGQAFPGLDEETRKAVSALFRQIASVRSWYFMTREHGLDAGEAAGVAGWAIDRLAEALGRGDVPILSEGDGDAGNI